MMEVNGVFDYNPDRWSGRMSTCHLRVYRLANNVAFAIATELAENRGPSITNSAEALATAVVREYDLDPDKTHFIEHYTHEPETYDLVSFTWKDGLACCATWKPTSKEVIEHSIGASL